MSSQLELLDKPEEDNDLFSRPWDKALLQHRKLKELDRATLVETIDQLLIFADHHVEITYTFSSDLGALEAISGYSAAYSNTDNIQE